jgi:hypothetical protein
MYLFTISIGRDKQWDYNQFVDQKNLFYDDITTSYTLRQDVTNLKYSFIINKLYVDSLLSNFLLVKQNLTPSIILGQARDVVGRVAYQLLRLIIFDTADVVTPVRWANSAQSAPKRQTILRKCFYTKRLQEIYNLMGVPKARFFDGSTLLSGFSVKEGT